MKSLLLSIALLVITGCQNESVYRKAPYLIYSGQNNSVTVCWQLTKTSQNKNRVQWGENGQYSLGYSEIAEANKDHQYSFTIDSLKMDTKYFFRVIAESDTQMGSFRTGPPDTAQDVSFFLYGDTRTHPGNHDKVAALMLNEIEMNKSLQSIIVNTGDLVANGNNEADWDQQFFDPAYPNIQKLLRNSVYVAALGNHERTGKLFAKYFPYPFYKNDQFYWSFDYGPVHFTIVDQFTDYNRNSAQYRWLEKDLSESKKLWKIIVLHKPGWSAGDHENNKTVQEVIQPLCEKYGVAMVLAGHNHYYARALVNGIYHITTGGGGAPLYDTDSTMPYVLTVSKSLHVCIINITGNHLKLRAIQTDRTVIDQFSIDKP